MNTKLIHRLLQGANLAEVSRQTGISVRRLFQLRKAPLEEFNVTIVTYGKLSKWADEEAKALKQ
jgi:hypothetical protein